MKKLGKKLSFLTKIMLVIGLLISNLSSLSVVFAYEVSDNVVINLVDNNLEISYMEELAEDVKSLNVKIYENYTYLDGLSIEEVVNTYSLDEEQIQLALAGNLKLVYESIFAENEEDTEKIENYMLFDGTYSVKVEISSVTLVENSNGVIDDVLEDSNKELVAIDDLELNGIMPLEVDTVEEIIASGEYQKEISYEKGLNIKLFNSNDEEISLVEGQYPIAIDNSKVRVVAQVLSGGLAPTDVFVYNDTEYLANELLNIEFSSEKDFSGLLYGEYILPIEVSLLKQLDENDVTLVSDELESVVTDETLNSEFESLGQYDEVIYEKNLNVVYGSYELNSSVLNDTVLNEELSDKYVFYSDSKDGILYVLSDFVQEKEVTDFNLNVVRKDTMLDLYNVVNSALGDNTFITYKLLKDGTDVLSVYDSSVSEQSLEEYLNAIELDETVEVILFSDGLTISYAVVIVADLDDDKSISEKDLLELINQVIGESEIVDKNKSDLYGIDEEINALDVLYLNQVIKTQLWDAEIKEETANLDINLSANVNDKESLVSGDIFDVEYIISLTESEISGFGGMFEYDKDSLELISVEAKSGLIGNYNIDNGKFLYLGEESFDLPEQNIDDTEDDVTSDNDSVLEAIINDEMEDDSEIVIPSADYVVLTAKFKALKAGTHTVSVSNNEYFNQNTYLVLDEEHESSASVVVAASSDNSLSYLEVAGQEITLEDNVYEYEIIVSNDVTLVDLKYIVNNVAANVTSTVFPEELVEGTNEVIITVTSESGVSQCYKIFVIREESVEEKTVNYVNNYYGNYDNDVDNEVVVTPSPEKEEQVDALEEDNNLSRIIIIILILIVIAGLVYLIFKDEDDETRKTNKDINKLKNESLDVVDKGTVVKSNNKSNNKTSNKTNVDTKNKKTNNKKKER